ncbi:hypothetical protein [[Eubacterium] cellulosolvens]
MTKKKYQNMKEIREGIEKKIAELEGMDTQNMSFEEFQEHKFALKYYEDLIIFIRFQEAMDKGEEFTDYKHYTQKDYNAIEQSNSEAILKIKEKILPHLIEINSTIENKIVQIGINVIDYSEFNPQSGKILWRSTLDKIFGIKDNHFLARLGYQEFMVYYSKHVDEYGEIPEDLIYSYFE